MVKVMEKVTLNVTVRVIYLTIVYFPLQFNVTIDVTAYFSM